MHQRLVEAIRECHAVQMRYLTRGSLECGSESLDLEQGGNIFRLKTMEAAIFRRTIGFVP